MHPVWSTMLLSAASASVAVAQAVPARVLTRPDAEFAQPFSSVRSIRELRDGRVLVADSREWTLHLVDLSTRTATTVGRRGSGPLEFGNLYGRLLAVMGDSTLFYDVRTGRFFVIDPAGKPVGTRPAVRTHPELGESRWGDARGSIYTTSVVQSAPEVPPIALLLRYAPSARLPDTAARLQMPRIDRWTSPPAADGAVGVWSADVPFAVRDDWAVFPDGRVAVVRGADYHLDFYAPGGGRTSGAATPFTPIPVTQADRDSVLTARRQEMGRNRGSPPPLVQPSSWQTTKAPFGENAAWAGPDGELWVEVSRRAGDTAPRFDVFDRAGVRRSTVTLPAGSRVVGFGARSVYAVRVDRDDLLYLQRFALRN